MSGRPEILFPLFGSLERLPGIGAKTAKALANLRIETPRDMLFTLPQGIIDRTLRGSVRDAVAPCVVTVEVEVERHAPPLKRARPYVVTVRDAATTFQIVFFHPRDEWIRKQLPLGARRIVSGRIELYDNIARMAHPDYIVAPEDLGDLPEIEPVYPLANGVTQRLMRNAARAVLDRLPQLDEWTDPHLLTREGWPDWSEALRLAHWPRSQEDVRPQAAARRRLAYDELFAHQMTLALARARSRRAAGRPSVGTGQMTSRLRGALPYALTSAQERCLREIEHDLGRPIRMNRLLQGDVGSGKTAVALLALAVAVEAGGQGVLMAPTEILARQHADGLRPLAKAAGIRLEVLTGRDSGQARARLLSDLAEGRIDVLVGTHAVFQKDVEFRDLRLAIVDEQHRFGVAQRLELRSKGCAADVLVMTATPIPRSLALAHYGEMDVSIIDEKPPGRKPVTTALVSADRIDEVVGHLRRAIGEGRRAYWVCPLVDVSEATDLAAAEERYQDFRAALGASHVGMIHGRMAPAEKDAAMARFVSGETSVLVATTVIEVGVNVPEASIMVIERAETFGLAQLHQLRGRVGRGSEKSTCLLMYQPPLTESGRRRLELLRRTEDGFEIAEEDLAMRGAGDVIGTAQSGLPRFRIADAERQTDLMAMAQIDARLLLERDPDLASDRGRAVRTFLWLMRQDEAIRLLGVA
ncbi:ATP-dependent DNA helicase RecG [Roseitranquillus sediminis]|uniref:ATP-dependent DNA helicase RecG n=1 Tax=Roseitranquillus sediminis TaxID=2809051 RepID=UPI001D0CC08A|nr:ATP-dependent DNA helicase RecG [Roseitranquillus sediminis]MBM9595627.1 ATP-dependent DNA helicase RecG [Roseitranquillus sediminis]